MNTNTQKLLISIFAAIGLTVAINAFLPTSTGIISNIFVVTILAHGIFLILGVLSLILCIAGFIKRQSFGYIFMIVGNFWLSLLEYYQYFIAKANTLAIKVAIPNLLIATILIVYYFEIFGSKKNIQR